MVRIYESRNETREDETDIEFRHFVCVGASLLDENRSNSHELYEPIARKPLLPFVVSILGQVLPISLVIPNFHF